MKNQNPSALPSFPHHRLVAYAVARELLAAVSAAGIRDATIRSQALNAAKKCCLNIGEAAGRTSSADRARVFAIARGECVECAVALEIAEASGDTSHEHAQTGLHLAGRLNALLGGLTRR